MALARIKSVEKLRYCSPGEWGKLLGLDRIPEAKTLREKIGFLSRQGEPYQWAGELGREWMEMEPEAAGVLYVDGHVRVYNGHQTELPRHYVSRQKLCLRATTDYWVNAMDGQPFFVINKEIDPGLLQVLEDEIVPPSGG
jgi:prepilin-type processing-associated H-X9-DG protein